MVSSTPGLEDERGPHRPWWRVRCVALRRSVGPPGRGVGSAGAGDAGLCKHRGGNAELAPGRVRDAFAGAVAGGDDEAGLQLGDVGAGLVGFERCLKIEAFLD